MSERIYMSSPDVGELEEQYVVAVLRSGWVAPLGTDIDAFEAEAASDRLSLTDWLSCIQRSKVATRAPKEPSLEHS